MFENTDLMTSSPVALVLFPLPARETFGQVDHQTIPVDLGDIGRGRDAEKEFVGLDRGQHRFKPRTQVHRIDDDHVIRTAQGTNNCPHRPSSGLENIDPVDHLRPDFDDHPGVRVLPNPLRSPVPPGLRELL